MSLTFGGMIISTFPAYRITIVICLILGCTHFAFGQKTLTFPLDTEGVSLYAFSSMNVDLSHNATTDDICSAIFSPIDNDQQGQGHHTIWLRFVVNNRQAKDTSIQLFFERPVSLIEVFRKDSNRLTALGRTGIRHPSTQAKLIYKLTSLPILLQKNRLDTFYLRTFYHFAPIHNLPFPRIYTGSSLPAEVVKQHFDRFEQERWFYFFLAGFSFLLAFWAFFKSAVQRWDKPSLYCGLMFLSYFFNTWLFTRTVHLPFDIFSEIGLVHPIGKWFNFLTPLFMWLLYRSFLNTRTERLSLYRFMTYIIWLFGILNSVHFVLSLRIELMPLTLSIEKAIETVVFIVQLILPFFLFSYWQHPIYRYAAWSSWIMLLGIISHLVFLRFGLDDYLPIGFPSVFFLSIPLAIDGILFMVALTIRDRQIAIENEQLQQQATANELKALRAQMNPHFIFNALNSIKSFTLNHDTEGANFYLTKFSKLIRQVLDNSRNERISLKSELETLILYLDMEKLRVGEKFNYVIKIADDVETEFIELPPMLIQPYVENAIWHGLMHKEEKGELTIELTNKDDKILIVKILDNGIGRQKAAELQSKTGTTHKSFGMKITAERLDIIRKLYQLDIKISIEDLKNTEGSAIGTSVSLQIPI